MNQQVNMKVATLFLIISLCVGATWTLAIAWHGETKEQIECMNRISKRVVENTQRIRALEANQEDLKGLPTQIASMSSDLRLLRKSVERLMTQLENVQQESFGGN